MKILDTEIRSRKNTSVSEDFNLETVGVNVIKEEIFADTIS